MFHVTGRGCVYVCVNVFMSVLYVLPDGLNCFIQAIQSGNQSSHGQTPVVHPVSCPV